MSLNRRVSISSAATADSAKSSPKFSPTADSTYKSEKTFKAELNAKQLNDVRRRRRANSVQTSGLQLGLRRKIDRSTSMPNNKIKSLCELNFQYRTLLRKLAAVIYMSFMWWRMYVDCVPHITFFKYLTNWGWTIELIYFTYALYLDIKARRCYGWQMLKSSERAICQGLSEAAFALQMVVVPFFWLIVYPRSEEERLVWWDIQFHGVGLALLVVDYMYRFMRFSMRSHKYVLSIAIVYSIIHISTVKYSGEPIYPGIHFEDAESFIIFILGLSTVVLSHKLAYLISNWSHLKDELKNIPEISKLILMRHGRCASNLSLEKPTR